MDALENAPVHKRDHLYRRVTGSRAHPRHSRVERALEARDLRRTHTGDMDKRSR